MVRYVFLDTFLTFTFPLPTVVRTLHHHRGDTCTYNLRNQRAQYLSNTIVINHDFTKITSSNPQKGLAPFPPEALNSILASSHMRFSLAITNLKIRMQWVFIPMSVIDV